MTLVGLVGNRGDVPVRWHNDKMEASNEIEAI
jgi:hypothetical protein